jgi:hypothetical protein
MWSLDSNVPCFPHRSLWNIRCHPHWPVQKAQNTIRRYLRLLMRLRTAWHHLSKQLPVRRKLSHRCFYSCHKSPPLRSTKHHTASPLQQRSFRAWAHLQEPHFRLPILQGLCHMKEAYNPRRFRSYNTIRWNPVLSWEYSHSVHGWSQYSP